MGKDVPDFDKMSIEELTVKYAALLNEGNCLPFTEEEFENLYNSAPVPFLKPEVKKKKYIRDAPKRETRSAKAKIVRPTASYSNRNHFKHYEGINV